MRFTRKVAIVTGGGSGIGRATALALAREGAAVVVADRVGPSAESVAKEIILEGGRGFPAIVDVARLEQVQATVADVLNRLEKIDVLVHCAGTDRMGPFVESTEKAWDLMVSVNLKGSFNFCHAVLKSMIEKRYGKVVLIASEAGKKGSPNNAVYAATKAGMMAFARSVALEVAPFKINVNCICPGPIRTPGSEWLSKPTPEDLERRARDLYVGRLGVPEDISATALFLCSDEASFITGQDLLVDGGGHIGKG